MVRAMIRVTSVANPVLVRMMEARMRESSTLHSQLGKNYSQWLAVWKNLPAWLAAVPEKKSKARDNRVFMALESIGNKVTARPSKPNVVPANESEEAKAIARNLQAVFLEKWKTLDIKGKLRRGLRFLFIAKLMVFKVYWNAETNDFDTDVVDPRKVYIPENAVHEPDGEYVIEEVEEPVLTMLDKFATDAQPEPPTVVGFFKAAFGGRPEKNEYTRRDLLRLVGLTEEQALVNNPKQEYHEFWIGDGVAWVYKASVLKKTLHPYYDFEGVRLTGREARRLQELNGPRRRALLSRARGQAAARRAAETATRFPEAYLFNHFDRPRKPYIWTSMFLVENKAIGETSYVEQANPLQEDVDRRKRQISDNADLVNGILKVDTGITTITLADAKKASYDAGGLLYGDGVMEGVKRETGEPAPAVLFNDMQDSRNEIDNLLGTTQTFRGEGTRNETATGRAILREEGQSRLDDPVSVVDYVMQEMYSWWLQMVRVKYTEAHLVKPLGGERATETIELMRDDVQEGVEVRVIPGQVLPEDRFYRAERAAEDAKAGVLDPLTYFETVGGYDNPKEVAKRLVMWKANPFSIIEMSDEDIQALQRAAQIAVFLQGGQPMGGGGDARAGAVAQIRMAVQQLVRSEDYLNAGPREKAMMVAPFREKLAAVASG